MSDDSFHSGNEDSPAKRALAAAEKLGIDSGSISISDPTVVTAGDGREKGDPVIGGGALFRGRAADVLTKGLPARHWDQFTECPHERLAEPKRVHVDAMGNVHLCQGISMGNIWQNPLAELSWTYQAREHPPLLEGGPAELVLAYDLPHKVS